LINTLFEKKQKEQSTLGSFLSPMRTPMKNNTSSSTDLISTSLFTNLPTGLHELDRHVFWDKSSGIPFEGRGHPSHRHQHRRAEESIRSRTSYGLDGRGGVPPRGVGIPVVVALKFHIVFPSARW
jgi:hypothetical protein